MLVLMDNCNNSQVRIHIVNPQERVWKQFSLIAERCKRAMSHGTTIIIMSGICNLFQNTTYGLRTQLLCLWFCVASRIPWQFTITYLRYCLGWPLKENAIIFLTYTKCMSKYSLTWWCIYNFKPTTTCSNDSGSIARITTRAVKRNKWTQQKGSCE